MGPEPPAKIRLRSEITRLHAILFPRDLGYPSTIILNLKFALRTRFKTPFVTIVAIVSRALGIDANAATLSPFNQLAVQPLPVPEPDGIEWL
jgi:hypothetical protein